RLHRVLVERVDDPGRASQVDVAILDLRLLRRVGDPLHGHQDLHGDSFLRFSRPDRNSACTQSAARTISNFFGRAEGAPAEIVGCSASPHASASSSIMPNSMRAAMWLGIVAS